jgi:NADH-quinone oxidoreductase subunit G
MPRPPERWVTFSLDDLEVRAPANMMLVDAAKYGDVEIPVFCYEPKLGAPVGACRMCLVEIEGIPKLQTACSTPVKDGMVVHTQTARVRTAQEAVVEFLLINHPLDCPVCDKGGECPLQDISFGWGGGRSRFIEPKRHFVKPLALSPLVAIDRERCILCYRCVRFSQEIAEDYQLVLEERGAHSYVATFDGHPYVAPFSGNICRAVPGGRADVAALPLPRAAVGHRGLGLGLHPVPVAVQRELHGARRARPARHGPRPSRGRRRLAVRQGPLRLPVGARGRAHHRAARARRRRPAAGRWERALDEAGKALARARGRVGALAGNGATNEEGFLLGRLLREGLESGDLDSRAGSNLPADLHRALAAPGAPGLRPRPRVGPRRAGARLRAGGRRPDPRPAPAQGRAPPRRQAGGRVEPTVVA